MQIVINKDIEKYQESVILGLTAKQFIFSVASLLVGGGIVLLLYKHIGLLASAYIAIPAVVPIALGGFYSFNGMSFYEVTKRKIYFSFFNKPLTYVSTESEAVIMAAKEEIANEEKAKKKTKRKGVKVE